MAYRLRFSGRAVREVGEAYEWYEAQSQGLGSEYEAAVELQLRRLEQAPMLYAEILPGVRRGNCERLGCQKVWQSGSHAGTKSESTGCAIPMHSEVKMGALAALLRQAEVAPEEFMAALHN